jgi:DNA-directed RNA polymerase specialized sigma24 family protein
MSSDNSITHWIAELEFGRADEAQEELWQRYFHRLVGLAKLELGNTPRSAADEEDVATAALQSFFAGATEGRFPKLRDRNDLWPLLAKIAAHEARNKQRSLLAEKLSVGPARNESAPKGPDDMVANFPTSLIEDELDPDFLGSLNKLCDKLSAALPDDQLRQIARRRLEGYTNSEIAKELGVIERTIERRLQLIRNLWNEELRKDMST